MKPLLPVLAILLAAAPHIVRAAPPAIANDEVASPALSNAGATATYTCVTGAILSGTNPIAANTLGWSTVYTGKNIGGWAMNTNGNANTQAYASLAAAQAACASFIESPSGGSACQGVVEDTGNGNFYTRGGFSSTPANVIANLDDSATENAYVYLEPESWPAAPSCDWEMHVTTFDPLSIAEDGSATSVFGLYFSSEAPDAAGVTIELTINDVVHAGDFEIASGDCSEGAGGKILFALPATNTYAAPRSCTVRATVDAVVEGTETIQWTLQTPAGWTQDTNNLAVTSLGVTQVCPLATAAGGAAIAQGANNVLTFTWFRTGVASTFACDSGYHVTENGVSAGVVSSKSYVCNTVTQKYSNYGAYTDAADVSAPVLTCIAPSAPPQTHGGCALSNANTAATCTCDATFHPQDCSSNAACAASLLLLPDGVTWGAPLWEFFAGVAQRNPLGSSNTFWAGVDTDSGNDYWAHFAKLQGDGTYNFGLANGAPAFLLSGHYPSVGGAPKIPDAEFTTDKCLLFQQTKGVWDGPTLGMTPTDSTSTGFNPYTTNAMIGDTYYLETTDAPAGKRFRLAGIATLAPTQALKDANLVTWGDATWWVSWWVMRCVVMEEVAADGSQLSPPVYASVANNYKGIVGHSVADTSAMSNCFGTNNNQASWRSDTCLTFGASYQDAYTSPDGPAQTSPTCSPAVYLSIAPATVTENGDPASSAITIHHSPGLPATNNFVAALDAGASTAAPADFSISGTGCSEAANGDIVFDIDEAATSRQCTISSIADAIADGSESVTWNINLDNTQTTAGWVQQGGTGTALLAIENQLYTCVKTACTADDLYQNWAADIDAAGAPALHAGAKVLTFDLNTGLNFRGGACVDTVDGASTTFSASLEENSGAKMRLAITLTASGSDFTFTGTAHLCTDQVFQSGNPAQMDACLDNLGNDEVWQGTVSGTILGTPEWKISAATLTLATTANRRARTNHRCVDWADRATVGIRGNLADSIQLASDSDWKDNYFVSATANDAYSGWEVAEPVLWSRARTYLTNWDAASTGTSVAPTVANINFGGDSAPMPCAMSWASGTPSTISNLAITSAITNKASCNAYTTAAAASVTLPADADIDWTDIACPAPANVANAESQSWDGAIGGAGAALTCSLGYLVDGTQSRTAAYTCDNNIGQWSYAATVPTCTPITAFHVVQGDTNDAVAWGTAAAPMNLDKALATATQAATSFVLTENIDHAASFTANAAKGAAAERFTCSHTISEGAFQLTATFIDSKLQDAVSGCNVYDPAAVPRAQWTFTPDNCDAQNVANDNDGATSWSLDGSAQSTLTCAPGYQVLENAAPTLEPARTFHCDTNLGLFRATNLAGAVFETFTPACEFVATYYVQQADADTTGFKPGQPAGLNRLLLAIDARVSAGTTLTLTQPIDHTAAAASHGQAKAPFPCDTAVDLAGHALTNQYVQSTFQSSPACAFYTNNPGLANWDFVDQDCSTVFDPVQWGQWASADGTSAAFQCFGSTGAVGPIASTCNKNIATWEPDPAGSSCSVQGTRP